jgi:hypothetical protein
MNRNRKMISLGVFENVMGTFDVIKEKALSL